MFEYDTGIRVGLRPSRLHRPDAAVVAAPVRVGPGGRLGVALGTCFGSDARGVEPDPAALITVYLVHCSG
jgi:hypothetical protein